jgi:hypothetical protein
MVGSIDRPVRPDQPDPPDRPDRSERPERPEGPKTPQDFDAKLAERLSTLTRASAYERLYARAQAQDAPFRERLAMEESAQPKDSLSAGRPERDLERSRTYWTEVPRFLAMWRDHAQKWPWTGHRKVEQPITSERRSEAADSVVDVYRAEPEISDAVRAAEVNIARRGWLEGFEFRLKSESRLLEKVAASLETSSPDSTAREISRQIPDAVRYTFCFRSGDYGAGYYDIKQRLEDCGYQMYYSKNSWSNPEYKGINTRWITPQGQRFEVQFHSSESFHAKHHVTHQAYERLRNPQTSSRERIELSNFQKMVSSWIPTPRGAARIADFKKEGF